jgi:hypothetical protein
VLSESAGMMNTVQNIKGSSRNKICSAILNGACLTQ